MNDMNTILSVPAVVALVQLGKAFGVSGKWALLLAVIVAIGINVGDYYLGTAGAWQAATQGLLLGLAAAGLYDVAKTASAVTHVGSPEIPEVDNPEIGATD